MRDPALASVQRALAALALHLLEDGNMEWWRPVVARRVRTVAGGCAG